jgi:hypothetical protein
MAENIWPAEESAKNIGHNDLDQGLAGIWQARSDARLATFSSAGSA